MAYEWQFSGFDTYTGMNIDWHERTEDTDSSSAESSESDSAAVAESGSMPPLTEDGGMPSGGTETALTEEQLQASEDLNAMFPDYLNGLSLVSSDGTDLTLDADGNGSFKEYVESLVMSSAQQQLDSGEDLSSYTWLTIENGTVTAIDYDAYLEYLGRSKAAPAFDALDLSAGENSLFGTESVDTQHFTEYSLENSTADGTMADESIIRMMNPLNYIGTEGSDTSQYWRIRFGTRDSDTSVAIPAILATELEMNDYDVDFALAWDQPHGGDYDLDELFTWADQVVAAE